MQGQLMEAEQLAFDFWTCRKKLTIPRIYWGQHWERNLDVFIGLFPRSKKR